MPPRASLGRNFLSLMTGQVLTWSFAAITLLMLPRYLGAEGAGAVGIGVTYGMLVLTIAGLGLATAITKEVAKGRENVASWLGLAIVLQVVCAGSLAVIATGTAAMVGMSDRAVFAVAVCCASVPFALISLTANAVFQGLERMAISATYEVFTKGLALTLVLAAILSDAGLFWVVIAMNAGAVLVAAVQLIHVRRLVELRVVHPSLERLRAIVRDGAPYLIIAVLWTGYTAADIFMLSFLATEEDAGIYSAPMRLFGTALFVPAALATVVFPRLVSSARADASSFTRLGGISLLVAGTTSGAMTIGAAVASDEAVVSLLGPEFERSGIVILVLCASLVPTALNTVGGRIAFADDRQSSIAMIGGGAVMLKLVLGLSLIPVFSRTAGNPAVGAALSLVVVEWAMLGAILAQIPRDIWTPDLRRRFAGLAVALSVGIGTLITLMALTTPWVAGAIGMVVYAALLVGLGTHPFAETSAFVRSGVLGRTHSSPAAAR